MEKDIRDFDLKAQHLRIQLANVINGANLPPSIVFFILKDVLIEVERLYTNAAEVQYQKFCEEAEKQRQEEEQTNEEELD